MQNGHDWITTFHKILQKQGMSSMLLKNVTLSLDDIKYIQNKIMVSY